MIAGPISAVGMRGSVIIGRPEIALEPLAAPVGGLAGGRGRPPPSAASPQRPRVAGGRASAARLAGQAHDGDPRAGADSASVGKRVDHQRAERDPERAARLRRQLARLARGQLLGQGDDDQRRARRIAQQLA